MTSNDLIQRYLLGLTTEEEVRKLEACLVNDEKLQGELLLQAELDAHLRQEVQLTVQQCEDPEPGLSRSSSPSSTTFWKWASGLSMLAATIAILLLSGLLLSETSTPLAVKPGVSDANSGASIARISGLSGSLIWTGDRGEFVRDISIGTKLAGGTIEGLAPDSWFELQFNDGSTVMISGTSTMTFADLGQKKLRLRDGRLSANVVPQKSEKPMLISTPSAVLEVLGTQFDIEASQASTSLNVNEGKVRLRRLSDGREVDVPARHLVIADDESDLTPERVQASVNHWKSQLNQQPGGYGKWLPATSGRPAVQKAIALVPFENQNVVLYLLSIPVMNANKSPVTVLSDSRFVVRGRMNQRARVYFGIGLSYDNGEFAGKFRGDLGDNQPDATIDSDGRFEVVYRLSNFSLDPCVEQRKDELAKRPDGLVLNEVWCFTHTTEPSGLEVMDIELLPPEN